MRQHARPFEPVEPEPPAPNEHLARDLIAGALAIALWMAFCLFILPVLG